MPTTFLGLKAHNLLAGFIGGVISLSFIQGLGLFSKLLAVFGGAAGAGYLSPVIFDYISGYFGVTNSIEAENALAFLVGLTSMNLLAGIYKLSFILKDKPKELLDRMLRR